MEVAGGMLILGILVLLAGLLVSALFVHLAAKLSGVEGATFGKAVRAVIANAIVSVLVSLVFSIVPLAGTLLGMLISLAVTLWVLRKIYQIGWGKALLLWVMQWIVLFILILVLGSVMGMSILAL